MVFYKQQNFWLKNLGNDYDEEKQNKNSTSDQFLYNRILNTSCFSLYF